MATPQAGYLLGVDLGTSNTVAVIRWPDGRTRPLLVDGAPVMPSAVFVDESGHVHVGRDAQRLAQTDPSRYEPNPKQRTEEPSILLGDREIPTVTLLTAILRAVADKAIEAIGFLPPAVLTYPAKWGSIRRELLQDAAAKAGFPPVTLVPEPIGAAHYFAQNMQQPIPVGASVAVFDFGGGTLDIAIVRNQGMAGFQVLGDGGLKDLGGLDVDAALVTHLGLTINHNAPQLWQRLLHPESTTDKRARRQFWDDVRGAKEMLSRTTVAPIPVPGVDHSIHLTRDELERLATPLLQRAVEETQRVITAAGLTPQQLHGLFLVGGASRIPLVSRMLHQRLGIAPIVLEQPELPVAEGSLAAVPQHQLHDPMAIGQTSGIPVNVTEPYTPPPGAESPQGMNAAPGGFITPLTKKPWWKKKSYWIAGGATALVLVLGLWFILRDPYPQEPMNPLTKVGDLVALGAGSTSDSYSRVEIEDGVAYYMTRAASGQGEAVAVELETGKEKWRVPLSATSGLSNIWAENGIIAVTGDNTQDPDAVYLLNAENGRTTATLQQNYGDAYIISGDRIIRHDSDGKQILGYDPAGQLKWTIPWDGGVYETHHWETIAEPVNSSAEESGMIFGTKADGTVAVWTAADGKPVKEGVIVQDPDKTKVLVYGDRIYVVSGDNGYSISAYDVKTFESVATIQINGAGRKPTTETGKVAMPVCGEHRFCIIENSDSTAKTGSRMVVIDTTDGLKEAWTSPAEMDVQGVDVLGESLVVAWSPPGDTSTTTTSIFDKDFEKVGADHAGWYSRIDSGSLLKAPWVGGSGSFTVTGLGALDSVETVLGTVEASACNADNAYLACVTKDGYGVWRFRD